MHAIRRFALIALAGSLLGCDGSEGGNQQVTIASMPTGTNVYTVSAGLAKLIQESAGVPSTIRPFSGSSVYIPMLHRGEVTLGLNTGIDAYLSFRGLPPYEAPMGNLRTLGMIFPLNIMFMVRANSDLYRIEDLRGERVVVTFRANAALEQLHRGILATGGLELGDIEPMTVAGLTEAVRALQEGRADAVPIGLGTALSLQVDSALADGIRYLTMGENEARLAETMPGTRVITIEPARNRLGVPDAIRVSSVPDMLNTGAQLSEELAYEIVRTIHTNWDTLSAGLAQLNGMTANDIAPADSTLPYHPGAVRYYREAGLWTDAHEANQAELMRLASSE